MTAAATLIGVTALTVVGAPLVGVALVAHRIRPRHAVVLPRRGRRTWSLVWPLITGATLWAASSAAVAAATLRADQFTLIATSHAALWAAALALAATGAFFASVLPDPLDAAACAVGLALVAAAGVLVAGPGAGDLPTGAINAALQASPIVAVASAADIDILRTEVLYRLSPLAHLRFDYPTWQATCGWYVGLAALAFVAMTRPLDRST